MIAFQARFSIFLLGCALLLGQLAGAQALCRTVVGATESGFSEKLYTSHYNEFSRQKAKGPQKFFERQIDRIRFGEVRTISESLALADSFAPQAYFGEMAKRMGGLHFKEPILLPHLSLKGSFPYIGIKKHRNLSDFKRRGRQIIGVAEIPSSPSEFFFSMQRLAFELHSLELSLMSYAQTSSRAKRFLGQVLPIINYRAHTRNLRNSSLELASFLRSISENSGYFAQAEFRSWRHHPFKILTAELAAHVLIPFYRSPRPRDPMSIEKLASDPKFTRAQRIRIIQEQVIQSFTRAASLGFFALFSVALTETGMTYFEGRERAKIMAEEQVGTLTGALRDSQSAKAFEEFRRDNEDAIRQSELFDLQRLQEQVGLTLLEQIRLEELSARLGH